MKLRNLRFIGKLRSYHFMVCLDRMYVRNSSLETSKLMEFWIAYLEGGARGNCGCLAMRLFWWYLLGFCFVLFFGLLLLKIPGKEGQTWEASVRGGESPFSGLYSTFC